MIKQLSIFVSACAMVFSNAASSDSLDQLGELTQNEFRQLSENVAAATHYKSIAPAEPLGTLGFDIALEVSSTSLDGEIFDKASQGGYSLDSFLVPRLHVHKGLPFNLDIAASLTSIPDSDFQIIGAELRYAILEGSVVTPALAVRGTYSLVTGVDEIDFNSAGVEVALSKGFAMFTPYGGVGMIFSESTAKDSESVNFLGNLESESFDQKKLFVGVNMNFGLVNVGFEGDLTGDYETYTAKIGFRF